MEHDNLEPDSNVSGLIRSFTKALKYRVSVLTHDDPIRKTRIKVSMEDEEKARIKASMEALLAKLFASISSVKAAYAQLQISQIAYDTDGIQTADDILVNELKHLSELKQSFLKKQIDPSPPVTKLLAEIQEQQALLKTYDIMRRQLESQIKVQDSDIQTLKEKLEETDRRNRIIEKKLKSSGPLFVSDDLHFSGLNPNHFISVLKHTVKSIRSFVKSMISKMIYAGWDLNAAANSIEPDIIYTRSNHVCFIFESFVCRKMFDGFQFSDFSQPNQQKKKQRSCIEFFNEFLQYKSMNQNELLYKNPNFGKFCQEKYIQLIHPKMELSFFGDLDQRNILNSGGYPETPFFTGFVEMAKRIWVLHCLAFSFEPEAKIFQMRKGCRFSDVYMESVAEDAFFLEDGSVILDARVGFTVVPGFKIGKTVIQCQIYPCG